MAGISTSHSIIFGIELFCNNFSSFINIEHLNGINLNNFLNYSPINLDENYPVHLFV